METPRLRRRDSGAVLVLALVFMVAASLMVIPLAGYATSNLGSTASLGVTRGVQTAADSIMDDAIESVRYMSGSGGGYPDFTNPPGTCTVPSSALPTLTEPNGGASYPILITCQGYPLTTTNPGCTPTTEPGCAFADSTASREVAFVAKSGGSTVLTALVEYWDFFNEPTGLTCPSNGLTGPIVCPQTGYAVKVLSWIVTPANA